MCFTWTGIADGRSLEGTDRHMKEELSHCGIHVHGFQSLSLFFTE